MFAPSLCVLRSILSQTFRVRKNAKAFVGMLGSLRELNRYRYRCRPLRHPHHHHRRYPPVLAWENVV